MTEERVPVQVTREEAQHYILLTLDRFRVMTLHLADNKSRLPSALNGNEGGLDLLYELEARDFYRNLTFLYTSDIFEVLSSEGLRELLLKCRELSDRFCLKVRIPEDIRVAGESLTSEPPLSQAVDEDKESLWDSFLGALQGEFNENPSVRSIFMDMGLNLIPLVGQAMDARDIIACLDKLVRQKRHQEIMVWVTLVLTAIGCVPGAGDVTKAIGKAIIKGADDIAITLLKKLDAEDAHRAFVKFRQTLQASTEEAVATINGWLKKVENRYKETELAELLSAANEGMNKAVDFVHAKVDEFGDRIIVEKSGGKGKWNKELNKSLEPNKIYKVDGYKYFTDGDGRVYKVSGKLKLNLEKERNGYQQGKAVEIKDGIEGEDQGGHLIARIFNGPGEQINYIPQNAKLNNGEWKAMENKWRQALDEGKTVEVEIKMMYDNKSKRPREFLVKYKIGGKPTRQRRFDN